MGHQKILPTGGDVAAPALQHRNGQVLRSHAVGRFDLFPELFIVVRVWGLMTAMTVFPLPRRMPVPRYIPRLDGMALPAPATEKPFMDIGVAVGALKSPAQHCVIHPRNAPMEPLMLSMALQALVLCLMEPKLSPHIRDVRKLVTLQALSLRDTSPRNMAEFALFELDVKCTQ